MKIEAEKYQVILDVIKERAMIEWAAQGHKMTGRVVEEIDMVVTQMADRIRLDLYLLPYGVYQQTGVKASRIPYSRGSGAGRSAYIEALAKWVQARMGLSGKQAKSAAFAIAETHKREGMPTRGAYAFSNNGKRTEWFSDAIENNVSFITAKVNEIVYGAVSADFTNMIKTLQNEFVS